MWVRFLLSVILMPILMTLTGTRPEARQGNVVELGPEVYSTLPMANDYQWYAAGYVYPAGTFDKLGDCDRPTDWRLSIGTYAIYGAKGNQSFHSAVYRITMKGESYYFQGEMPARDDKGRPATSLFQVTLKVNGDFVEEDPQSQATYTPHSTSCFGGTWTLFKGQSVTPDESPQFQTAKLTFEKSEN